MDKTPGDRLFLIRLACGDGFKSAEPMPKFAQRVLEKTGRKYHDAALSLLERMQQTWKLDDLNAFAAVDPKGRGPAWLAWGDQGGRPALKPPMQPTPEGETMLPGSGGPKDT